MVQVKEVKTRSELKKFVNYPNILYRDVPQYVPAMIGDDLDDWNPKKNPAVSSLKVTNSILVNPSKLCSILLQVCSAENLNNFPKPSA